MKKSCKIKDQKDCLRADMRVFLKRLRSFARKKKSAEIARQVVGLRQFQSSKKIMIYAALDQEVQTEVLLKEALKSGKEVFVPCVRKTGKESCIFPVNIACVEDLNCKGAYGIAEPGISGTCKIFSGKLDLIIVPALAFDLKGHRLGKGGGYFDRFLARQPKAVKLGIAFKEQIVKKVPCSNHDVLMDIIVTD